MHALETHDMPGHLIRRLQQIAVTAFTSETGKFGITPVQYAILVAVGAQPGHDQRGLSQLVAFDRSTIGDVVERLEGRGLLRREPGREDRRTKLLYPTKLGQTTVRDMRPYVERVQQRILEVLSADEQGTFMTLLKKLVHRRNELASGSSWSRSDDGRPATLGEYRPTS